MTEKKHTSNVDANYLSDRPQDQVLQMMDFRLAMGWEPLPRYETYKAPGLRRSETDLQPGREVELDA